MKNTMILLALTMLVSCSVDKDSGDKTPPPGPETEMDKTFKAAIDGKTMLNSSGTTWEASATGSLSVLKEGTTTVFVFKKATSTTQAIYTKFGGGIGFVGVALEGDKVYLYKKGTVLTWDKEEDVSFETESKVVNSAKGEFIDKAKGDHFLDNQSITLKEDGNVYVGDTLLYTHIETQNDETKDKSIYQKSETEFIGLSVEQTGDIYSLFFYRPSKGAGYFTTKETVQFLPEHKFSPKEDFVVLAKGIYPDVYDYREDKFTSGDLELKDDGNIYTGSTVLYTFVGIKTRTEALYADQNNKYIGFKLVEGTPNKIVLYKKEFKVGWDSVSDISFGDTHKITATSFFFINLPIGNQATTLGQETYTIQVNGNLHLKRNNTLAFSFHKPFGEGTDLQQNQAIYKTTDNKFVGIDVHPIEKVVTLYQENKTSPWNIDTAVSFNDIHKVATSDTWEAVGTGLNAAATHWTSGVIDNAGNFYVSYRDGTKGTVDKFIKSTGQWENIAKELDGTDYISANQIAIDSSDNLYWAMHRNRNDSTDGIGNNILMVRKYTKSTGTWAVMGDENHTLGKVNGVKGTYPSIHVDKDNNIYILGQHITQAGTSVVKKWNTVTSAWDTLGQAEIPIGLGSKRIFSDPRTGALYIASNPTQINGGGILKAYKYNLNTSLWVAMGTTVADNARDISLTVNNKSEVFVAYNDADNGQKVTVKKWNTGTSAWDIVGTAGFGDGKGEYLEINYYSDGAPVVITSGDGGSNFPIYAYTFNGSNWVKVGKNSQISGGNAYYAGVAVDRLDDIVYAAYHDLNNSGKLAVRQHRKP